MNWILSGVELVQLADVCRGRFIEVDKFVGWCESVNSGCAAIVRFALWQLVRKYPKREFNLNLDPSGGESINVNPPAWTPRMKMPPPEVLKRYTYWAIVWIRINCTYALL